MDPVGPTGPNHMKEMDYFGSHFALESGTQVGPTRSKGTQVTKRAPKRRPSDTTHGWPDHRRYRHSRMLSARAPMRALYRFHSFALR